MVEIRTRFAPSPTGFMHLGNLRTALYAYAFAKKNNGKFILRIEDTDQKRYVGGAVEVIYDTLRECGLYWDEGPYIQSERKEIYKKYAEQLIQKNMAYYDGDAIRQIVPKTGSTAFADEIYGEITINNSEIEEQILIKSDGMPTYNFANVIDDHEMGINCVIRGNEYLTSTPKYVLLYHAFGWDPPMYIHCPQIMRDATHKLSKRDGDAYFSDFKAKGYLTEAIINYIALLGWSPRSENEIFTLKDFANMFDLAGISKSPAIFDEVKMRAMNAAYIRALPHEKFVEIASPYIGEYSVDYDILCAVLQPRTEILSDIPDQIDFIEKVCEYGCELYNNKKMKTTVESAKEALKTAMEIIEKTEFSRNKLYETFKAEADLRGLKIGWFLYPIQVAVTGKSTSPGGGLDACLILGKGECVRRIDAALKKL